MYLDLLPHASLALRIKSPLLTVPHADCQVLRGYNLLPQKSLPHTSKAPFRPLIAYLRRPITLSIPNTTHLPGTYPLVFIEYAIAAGVCRPAKGEHPGHIERHIQHQNGHRLVPTLPQDAVRADAVPWPHHMPQQLCPLCIRLLL